MKVDSLARLLSAVLLFCRAASAQDPPAKESSSIRVEVLMVALPMDKALLLMPDLRDPEKIDAATDKILDSIARREATLTGYPILHSLDGKPATSETAIAHKYTTDYSSLITATSLPRTPPKPGDSHGHIVFPYHFETRNVGITMETYCEVLEGGQWIQVGVLVKNCTGLGATSIEAAKFPDGTVAKIEQPNFGTATTSSTLKLKNGQRALLGFHLMAKPENHLELYILQAWATPAK